MAEETWVTVAETNGITPAELLVNHLKAAGIPARAAQEGAGRAMGLTVGLLGTAYVLVPPEYREEAEALLGEDALEEAPEEDVVTCPTCETEAELDEAEWEQGWFRCPACGEIVDLEDVL